MKFRSLITAVATGAVILTSCLKAHNITDVLNDKGSIVSEISDVSYYGDTKVLSLNASPATEEVTLLTLKTYAPRSNKPGTNVTVHLVRNDALATAQGLTIPPTNGIVITSLDVVVDRATGIGELKATVNKNNLDLSKVYGMGFDIASVSEGVISELGKEITVAVIVKNAYDANYSTSGFVFHPSAPRAMANTKHLATLGAVRCQAPLGDLAGYYFNFDVSGSALANWQAAGSCPPAPQSGFFTADNPGGIFYDPALTGGPQPGTAPYVQTTYNNSYNSSTKTFWMHYGYGVGSTGQNGWSRSFYEKWVRL